MKTVGGFRRTRYRGLDRTGFAGYLVATAYNLVRLSRLAARQSAIPSRSLTRRGKATVQRGRRGQYLTAPHAADILIARK